MGITPKREQKATIDLDREQETDRPKQERLHLLTFLLMQSESVARTRCFAPTDLLENVTIDEKNKVQNRIPLSLLNWKVAAQLPNWENCRHEPLVKTINNIPNAAPCIFHIHNNEQTEFALHSTLSYILFYIVEFKNY